MNIDFARKSLPNSDVSFSALSLGTVKFGRNRSIKYPTAFDLPDDTRLAKLLTSAFDAGITSLDTAPAYGIAEQRLGNLFATQLKGKRQAFEIISKAGECYDSKSDRSTYQYRPEQLRKQLENSLRLLHTDYLDCWLLHSNGDDETHLNDDVIHCLQQAKKEGWVRSIGASTKTVTGGTIALQELDCVMMTASLSYHDEDELFKTAKALNKAILLKKIFDSGWALNGSDSEKHQHLIDTFAHLFSHDATTSAVIGTLQPKHLLENVEAFIQGLEEIA